MLKDKRTKWEINQELINHCAELLKIRTKKINGYNVQESFFLDKSRLIKLHILEEEKFFFESDTDTIEDKNLIKLAEKLRPHLSTKHGDFYKKFDELLESDSKVGLSSKGQKLIYQIAFNLDKIPELKSEIIEIGKLLEKDGDIFEHYNF